MRILVVCVPQLGHVHPLLPLAQALVDAGHTVRFATGASVRKTIEGAGFAVAEVRPAGLEEGFRVLAERVGGPPGAGLGADAAGAPHHLRDARHQSQFGPRGVPCGARRAGR